jgi:hypothetical protein
MYKIEIEISDSKAREWRQLLADRLKRETGKTVRNAATLDEVCKVVLLRQVADEAVKQAIETEETL